MITVNKEGRTYKVSEIAKLLGVSTASVRNRIKANIDPFKPYGPISRAIVYRGKTYSIRELSKIATTGEKGLWARLNSGMPVEDAVNTPLHNPKFYIYDGRSWSLTDLCRDKGLNIESVRYRLRVGMTITEAIDLPIAKTKTHLYLGELRTSKEIAKLTGVKYHTLMYRLRKGRSINEAIDGEYKK